MGDFGGLLGKCAEIKRGEQFTNILQKQQKSENDIQFITKYIDSTIKKEQLQKLTGQLETQDYNEVLRNLNSQQMKEKQLLYEKGLHYDQFDLIFVAQGEVKVIYGSQDQQINDFKTFTKGDMIFLDEQYTDNILGKSEDLKNTYFNLISKNQSMIAFANRVFFNNLFNESQQKFEELFKEKINSIKLAFPNLLRLDQATQREKSKFFLPYSQQTYGTVLSTTTSGSNDLFLIARGKILIWVPKTKINNDYSRDFVILGLISNNCIFNETNVLFNRECIYGTIIVSEGKDNEIYQLKKESIAQVIENMDSMKANCEIKERMYKNHIKRYSSYGIDQIEQKQKELLQKYGLDLNEITELFKKSTKDKKIVTHNIINKADYNKNLMQFQQIVKTQNIKTSEMQGDKESIAITATPRVASKGLNQMDSQAKLALLTLRAQGKDLREGNKGINQKITDVDAEKLIKEQNLIEEKQKLDQGLLVKKNIQQIDLRSKTEEKKSLAQKLDQDNSTLLKKLTAPIQPIQQSTEKQQNQQESNDNKVVKMSEFSLNCSNQKSGKSFNSAFLGIAQDEIKSDNKPQANDKFEKQRKNLLKLGI